MRNILIRSGISPLDTFDAAHMIVNNSIGSNVGNLVYAYTVYRTLMTENTNIVPDYYNTDPSQKRADEINEKYDCYVIPLADAFRPTFIRLLRRYTKLIKKLTIPVYVIGVGLRAPFEPNLDEGFDFDKDVKEFVEAVLEKSNIIGVRGEITAKYLSKLGFREDIDHTVIGCPSMYAFGKSLKIRDTKITKDSMVCVNSSMSSPKVVLDFITRSMKEFPNYYFIPQWLKEMKMTYLGTPSLSKDNTNYPSNISSPVYRNNRVRYFLNVPTWLDFISKADLSFGARLHGNITATIAGTPSLIIPKDARMRELAEYHNLTSLWWDDINENTRLEDIIEKSDFKSPEKVQEKNFNHFINFLNKNNIEHVYKESLIPNSIPLDDKIAQVNLLPPFEAVASCSNEQLINRWGRYHELVIDKENIKKEKQITKQLNKISKHKKQIDKLNSEVAKNNKKIKHLEGTLNRKSAKAALKLANLFRIKR